MNNALTRGDVECVCIETARCFLSKGACRKSPSGVDKIASEAIDFFEQQFLGCSNTYVLELLERRCAEMAVAEDRLQRASAIELMVFLATAGGRSGLTVSKPPRKAKEGADPEIGLTRELRAGEDGSAERIEHFVTALFRAGDEERLWRVVHQLSVYPEHAHRLHGLVSAQGPKKAAARRLALLHAGFRTLPHGSPHVRHSGEYKPIVIQCMLKSEYLFDDLGVIDRQSRLYTTCLYHLPSKSSAQTRRVLEGDEPRILKTLELRSDDPAH